MTAFFLLKPTKISLRFFAKNHYHSRKEKNSLFFLSIRKNY